MKQRHRLSLLAAVVLCTFPLTASSQTAKPGLRMSHVPIEGGIAPALADQFLNNRFQQADAEQMQRLLNDLANNPQKLGINDADRQALEKALEKAGGQPEKLLQDKDVERIVKDVAGRQQNNTNLPPEDRDRLKDLRDSFLPSSERPPLSPPMTDGGPRKPDVAPQTKVPDPRKPSEVPTPPTPPPGLPAPPAPTPSPSPNPPAKSPVNDSIRKIAERFADKGLADSPAFRRMLTNLTRVKAPEANGFGSWERRLEKMENGFADVGRRLPSFSWPKMDFSQRAPSVRAGADFGTSRDGLDGAGQVVLGLLGVGAVALLVWGLLRRRGLVVLGHAGQGWRLGPWPVRPEAVATRAELVRAFEYLALLLLGPTARNHNHHEIAAEMGEQGADHRAAADRLADLYEQARYAPPDETLPDADLAAARADLSLLARVASA